MNTTNNMQQNDFNSDKEVVQQIPFLGFDDKERNSKPQPTSKLQHPCPILELNMPQCIPFMGF